MRVTIAHNKTKQEVMQIVDKSANDMFTKMPALPAQIIDPQKRWEGSTMFFSFVGKKGFFKTTITGSVEVTDKDVIVNCELPSLISHFISEDQVRAGIETQVKGLLA
jgi:hypothetical protein